VLLVIEAEAFQTCPLRNSNTPNGVRKSGAAEPVRMAADLRIHDGEGLALRQAMVNPTILL